MFPEGTRHGGDDLLPFKKGAFHVAISSQCPLQPIVVSRYYFLNSKKRIFDPGNLVFLLYSFFYFIIFFQPPSIEQFLKKLLKLSLEILSIIFNKFFILRLEIALV